MLRHTALVLALIFASGFLAGCTTRSISDVQPWNGSNPTYAGELSDFDVIGLGASDGTGHEPRLHEGQRLLVVQSGALFPDETMLGLLREHFDVGIASGRPGGAFQSGNGVRAAAERGGYDAVLAYWGVLEATTEATIGKAAHWIPIGGLFVNDEIQRMRIRLRLVLLDPRSGRWRSFLPTPAECERSSSLFSRARVDLAQIDELKATGYRVAVEQLAAKGRE